MSHEPSFDPAGTQTLRTSSAGPDTTRPPFRRPLLVVMVATLALLLGAIILAQSRLDPVAGTTGLTGGAGSLDHADHFWGPFPDVVPTVSLTPSGTTTIQSISVADARNLNATGAAIDDPSPTETSTVAPAPADR
jgi:hypothetical protein